MINNNLQHISVGLDEILTDMLTRCMLNPDNKDFYIGNLTLDKVKQYFAEMPQDDVSVASVFWNAYSRAEAQYLQTQKIYYTLKTKIDDIANKYIDKYMHKLSTCPECGCKAYVAGVACPNCDYTEEV